MMQGMGQAQQNWARLGGMGKQQIISPAPQQVQQAVSTKDKIFDFIPVGCQRYIMEWGKTSKKGAICEVDANDNFSIMSDHEHGNNSCKALGKNPFVFDANKHNIYYFQLKIEIDHDKQVSRPMPGSLPTVKSGIKISVGFCRDNLDLNKNSIIENKGKEFYVLDLFDGETYCSAYPGVYNKFVNDQNTFKEGDVIGTLIDLEQGVIQFYKNGELLGMAFNFGQSNVLRKGKLYPFIQLYKCTVSVYQPF